METVADVVAAAAESHLRGYLNNRYQHVWVAQSRWVTPLLTEALLSREGVNRHGPDPLELLARNPRCPTDVLLQLLERPAYPFLRSLVMRHPNFPFELVGPDAAVGHPDCPLDIILAGLAAPHPMEDALAHPKLTHEFRAPALTRARHQAGSPREPGNSLLPLLRNPTLTQAEADTVLDLLASHTAGCQQWVRHPNASAVWLEEQYDRVADEPESAGSSVNLRFAIAKHHAASPELLAKIVATRGRFSVKALSNPSCAEATLLGVLDTLQSYPTTRSASYTDDDEPRAREAVMRAVARNPGRTAAVLARTNVGKPHADDQFDFVMAYANHANHARALLTLLENRFPGSQLQLLEAARTGHPVVGAEDVPDDAAAGSQPGLARGPRILLALERWLRA